MMGRKPKDEKITLNAYLSNYPIKRNLDKVVIKWYQRRDERNTPRTKTEWDALITEFFNEK